MNTTSSFPRHSMAKPGIAVVASCVLLASCITPSPERGNAPPSPSLSRDSELPALEEVKKLALAHEWDDAIDRLSSILIVAPESWEALRWRGHAYTGRGDYQLALEDLTKALAIHHSDAWTRYAHSMALHHMGEYQRAHRGYTMALELDPSFTKALEWRGYTASLMGEHLAAWQDLNASIVASHENTWLFAIRAKTLLALGQFEAAEEDLWRACDGDPGNAEYPAQLGFLAACNGDPEGAIRHLRHAIKLDGEGQGEARTWLAELLFDEGKVDEANRHCAVLARTDPERNSTPYSSSDDWLQCLGRFLLGECDGDALLARARKGEDQEAVSGRLCEAWLHIGLRQQRLGQLHDAMLDYARCVGSAQKQKWEWLYAHERLQELSTPMTERARSSR